MENLKKEIEEIKEKLGQCVSIRDAELLKEELKSKQEEQGRTK